MSDLPRDIERAAIKAFEEIAKSQSSLNGSRVMIIARALLEERERCAKVAEQTAQAADDFVAKHFENGKSIDFQRWSEGCRQVAANIRFGKQLPKSDRHTAIDLMAERK